MPPGSRGSVMLSLAAIVSHTVTKGCRAVGALVTPEPVTGAFVADAGPATGALVTIPTGDFVTGDLEENVVGALVMTGDFSVGALVMTGVLVMTGAFVVGAIVMTGDFVTGDLEVDGAFVTGA